MQTEVINSASVCCFQANIQGCMCAVSSVENVFKQGISIGKDYGRSS